MEKRPSSFTWLYAVALIGIALPAVVVGLVLALRGHGYTLLSAGVASLVAVLVAWPLASALEAARTANAKCFSDLSAPLEERMQQISIALDQISEQQLISERAKVVAFREKDRDALRRAIHEEMNNKDWDAALALANDFETTFGYKQEADRLRGEINGKRQDVARRQISEHVAVIDRHTRAESWQDALKEAERTIAAFPDDAQVRNLPHEIEQRRQAHKRHLLDSWKDALDRNDVDGGIEILKRLDPYLGRDEAEALQEPARHLFKAKLDSLRTQFSVAVQDHRWAEAARVGEVIVVDFPNTRIAQEVRDTMDALRRRAADPNADPAPPEPVGAGA